MKIEGEISMVHGRKSVNQRGQEVTYYDAYFVDLNPDRATQFPGEIAFKPSADEIKELNIVEGSRFAFFIRQVLEVRNGLPVVRVVVKPLASAKPLPERPKAA